MCVVILTFVESFPFDLTKTLRVYFPADQVQRKTEDFRATRSISFGVAQPPVNLTDLVVINPLPLSIDSMGIAISAKVETVAFQTLSKGACIIWVSLIVRLTGGFAAQLARITSKNTVIFFIFPVFPGNKA